MIVTVKRLPTPQFLTLSNLLSKFDAKLTVEELNTRFFRAEIPDLFINRVRHVSESAVAKGTTALEAVDLLCKLLSGVERVTRGTRRIEGSLSHVTVKNDIQLVEEALEAQFRRPGVPSGSPERAHDIQLVEEALSDDQGLSLNFDFQTATKGLP